MRVREIDRVRERERDKQRERERERESECVCGCVSVSAYVQMKARVRARRKCARANHPRQKLKCGRHAAKIKRPSEAGHRNPEALHPCQKPRCGRHAATIKRPTHSATILSHSSLQVPARTALRLSLFVCLDSGAGGMCRLPRNLTCVSTEEVWLSAAY